MKGRKVRAIRGINCSTPSSRAATRLSLLIVLTAWLLGISCLTAREVEVEEVQAALEKSIRYFHGFVSRHGGYVYYTSPGFSGRPGEGVAGKDEIWVQPPATPTVGEAFLSAYRATKRPLYLKAARDAAGALQHGQLESGGWTNSIDFDPGGAGAARYREGRIKEYWDQYNLNDDIAPTVVATLILAQKIYGREDCLSALEKLGEFLIRSRMPAPQAGWAQQYNYNLEPIRGRAFEPPAISGRETEGVIVALLEKSELPGEMLARYYELKTNRPLYMHRQGKTYTLTYDDKNLPSHYGWKTPSRVSALRQAYQNILGRKQLPDPVLPVSEQELTVRDVRESLDEEGRWVSSYAGGQVTGQAKFQEGEQYLDSAVFSRNLTILADSLMR